MCHYVDLVWTIEIEAVIFGRGHCARLCKRTSSWYIGEALDPSFPDISWSALSFWYTTPGHQSGQHCFPGRDDEGSHKYLI